MSKSEWERERERAQMRRFIKCIRLLWAQSILRRFCFQPKSQKIGESFKERAKICHFPFSNEFKPIDQKALNAWHSKTNFKTKRRICLSPLFSCSATKTNRPNREITHLNAPYNRYECRYMNHSKSGREWNGSIPMRENGCIRSVICWLACY